DSNDIMQGKGIPETWKETEIIPIKKQGKAEEQVASYRPITLANQDYKIFTKILAKRLEVAIPDLTQEDQYGFVKGRYIGDPIRIVLNIMADAKSKQTKVTMVKLDIRV
ncbi:reverse transcriptase domain-containing protein, partial [Salmonella sp. s60131]|uniref:reverse transcriptase domain-containing protein n=1 Tax=Salmonella sp. s60131 TaxID=3159722 RepID=UPI003980D2DA